MYLFEKTKANEYRAVFDLMKVNMYHMQNSIGLPWNQEQMERSYKNKLNYSIFRMEKFVGFISVEVVNTEIFIHTLQVVPEWQNSFVGFQAFKYLLNLAKNRHVSFLRCCVFENNPAKKMYFALGFREISSEKRVLKLELNLTHKISIPSINNKLFSDFQRI